MLPTISARSGASLALRSFFGGCLAAGTIITFGAAIILSFRSLACGGPIATGEQRIRWLLFGQLLLQPTYAVFQVGQLLLQLTISR